ncbi:MAG TPA: hypothetical protein VG347_15905 [Verrucomicrobiae bacterium]|nr:hypothetical protein [Verrucomicrobiae bacterium]
MKPNSLKKVAFAINVDAGGFLRITPKMIQTRAGDLAEIKGRYACDVTEADLTQARRELTGEVASQA